LFLNAGTNIDYKFAGNVKVNKHGIPTGGLFSLVSCPHYFGEVLFYVSTLVMLSGACRCWCLVVLYNLVAHTNMAMNAHVWYKQTFGAYPPERKALIPWLL